MSAVLEVTLRMAVVKQCPYVDETDIGELVITIPGEAPELHQLAGRIASIAAEPAGVSHEQFTQAVAWLLPAGSRAVTRWRTGPFDVQVEATAPELADTQPVPGD